MRDEGLDHLLTMHSSPMVFFDTVPIDLRIACCQKLVELASDDYRRVYIALTYTIQDALKRQEQDEASAIAKDDMTFLLDSAKTAAHLPYEESFVDLMRGLALLNGCGLSKNTTAAIKLFEDCASYDKRFSVTPIAHKILGDLYHHGSQYGFEPDWNTAIEHYRRTVAADNFPPFVDGDAIQGGVFATMARMLCDGGHGLELDLDEAELCATCASALENWEGASIRIEIAERRADGAIDSHTQEFKNQVVSDTDF